MISYRRNRYAILAITLTVLVIWYVFTAKESTQNSPFYRKTVEAIDRRRNEGPQALGSKHFLKGGSIRPEEQQKPIDTDPIDLEETLAAAGKEIDAQMGKKQDLISEVEAMDKGLEDADSHLRPGKTKEDLEIERQIIQARKLEQEKLKEEIRNQLKHKERERQKFLSHGKVVNPDWVGAFEKERKPPRVAGQAEFELAPDLDPFRDKVPDTAPPGDPYRDAPAENKPLVQHEEKHEQQKQALSKEQDFLHAAEPTEPEKQIDEEANSDDAELDERTIRRIEDTIKHVPAYDSAQDQVPAAAVKYSDGTRRPAAERQDIDPNALKGAKSQPQIVNAQGQKPINKAQPISTATTKKAAAALKVTTSSKSTPSSPAIEKTPTEIELSRLMALSPVVIFSKSYCPHSKKAKKILLQYYEITPTPYVVELDQHELGAELQQLLKNYTGRGTVPNIMVDGISFGGGSEAEAFWKSGELADVIKEMGGKRVLRVVEKVEPE